jgi:hypothetical protein
LFVEPQYHLSIVVAGSFMHTQPSGVLPATESVPMHWFHSVVQAVFFSKTVVVPAVSLQFGAVAASPVVGFLPR